MPFPSSIKESIKDYPGEVPLMDEIALNVACQKIGITTIDELSDSTKVTGQKFRDVSGRSGQTVINLAVDLLALRDRDVAHLLYH